MFPAYAYLSAYDRHKKLINDYLTYYGGSVSSLTRDTSRDKTDYDVIRENHRFLWDQDKDVADSWGARLAKKYYDKLFKEYCIADLTYYKHNQIALRWRTEREVVIGKGQFQCGNKMCMEKEALRSWEVNFGYIEHGEKKNALVKLRLCPKCSNKLNHSSQKREAMKKKQTPKRLGTNLQIGQSSPSTSQAVTNSVQERCNNVGEEKAERLTHAKVELDQSTVWKGKRVEGLERTREEEFEDYLADLFV